MSPGNVFHELKNLLSLLLRNDLALASNDVIDIRGAEGYRTITWANNSNVSGHLFRFEYPTVSEYQEWVDSQGYSAILCDGSIIQISYNFRFSELVGHRLLYFPCPFKLDISLLDTLTLSQIIDLYCDEGTDVVRLMTPVRFDYDPESHAENHPASHMTFQNSHVRIGVRSPLSLGHFIQFVFENFYPSLWSEHEFLNQWPRDELDATITPIETGFLHFSWREQNVINIIRNL